VYGSGITALAFESPGLIAAGSYDGQVTVWDLAEAMHPPRTLKAHDRWITTLAFAGKERLVSGSQDGTLRVWDLTTPVPLSVLLRKHVGPVNSMVVNASGGQLISGGYDGFIYLWNLKSSAPQPEPLYGTPLVEITALACVTGRSLVGGCRDGSLRVWDLKNPTKGKPISLQNHQQAITALSLVEGGILVSASEDGIARVYSAASLGQPIASPPQPIASLSGDGTALKALAVSPDSRRVAAGTGGSLFVVRVWDLAQPQVPPQVLRGHKLGITALGFLPDGRLASGSVDSTVRLWNLERKYERPVVLGGHGRGVTALASAPDGRLIVGSGDGEVRVWDLETGRLVKEAAIKVGRNLNLDEWQQFFGDEPYRCTFPDCGPGFDDSGRASQAGGNGQPSSVGDGEPQLIEGTLHGS
jgi:WD40 repeat protein